MRALIPEGGLTTFRKEMDRFLDRFWDGDEALGPLAWAPDVDVTETAEHLTVRAELPGVDPKDLQITLENGVLVLRGEKKQVMEHKDERLYRNERHYGAFSRALRLPTNVDAKRVNATFKNGVLTVTLPRDPQAKGQSIPIRIE